MHSYLENTHRVVMLLAIFSGGLYAYIASKSTEGGAIGRAIGRDPISLMKPRVWITVGLIFAAGFPGEYRGAGR
jgi:hypothetical protein